MNIWPHVKFVPKNNVRKGITIPIGHIPEEPFGNGLCGYDKASTRQKVHACGH